MSVVLPTGSPFTFPSAISAALPESGGTSGIVVDNIASGGQGIQLLLHIAFEFDCKHNL